MRVAVATLGCKVNQYDSAAIESRLRHVGCEIVAFAPGADVYIVNTCTVTDRADAESRQLARRARRFDPRARVIMTGCFAQTSPQRAAFARRFVGTTMRVLVEDPASHMSGAVSGYSRNYQRVEFHGPQALANREVAVDVVVAQGATLLGHMQTTRWAHE